MPRFERALRAGGSVLVIADEAHRRALAKGLRDLGFDPATCERVVLLDTAQLLRQLLVDGSPSPERFEALVAPLVSAAVPPVEAYGELVGLCWGSGDVLGAIELERLWSRLGRRVPFELVCGFPEDPFRRGRGNATDDDAGAAGEPRQEQRFDLVLDRSPRAARAARSFVREVLSVAAVPDLDVALLVSTELISNALEHGRGEMSMTLTVGGEQVRIAVHDEEPNGPVLRHVAPASGNGRGLLIVERLSGRWGVDRRAGGKTVWADLPREGPAGKE